jgi:hypothetical protein
MARASAHPPQPRFSRRQFAVVSGAAVGAAGFGGHTANTATAQYLDPFTYITTMPETETFGQRAGQWVDETGPVTVDGVTWTSMVQVPIKRGQDLQYTCEFDTAWSIMMAYGLDVPLAEQLEHVGIDNRFEPYWVEAPEGIVIHGGDIGESFCGDLDANLVARAKGSAMRKVFEAQGLSATPVHDRAGIEGALHMGQPVFFKATVDFLPWQPATWLTPEGKRYQVVFSNDHALAVIAYNDSDVVIRDPLGPTSTNDRRPYQYRVSWERFLLVFASQENDGLAIGPSGSTLPGGALPGDGTAGAMV